MIKKTFTNKGQYINYYNKVINNPKITYATGGWWVEDKCWVIHYSFDKKDIEKN